MLLLCLSLLAGFAFARAIWPAPRRWSACDPVRLAAAPLLGIGLAGVVFYLVRVAAGAPPVSAIGTFAALTAAAVATAWWRSGSAGADPAAYSSRSPLWLTALAVIAAALAALSYVMMVAAAPHGEWDAWSIWNLKARFFFRAAEFVSPFSPLIEWSHPDYPVLLPSAIALFWHAGGEESARVVALLQALLAVSAVAVPVAVLRHTRGGRLAAIAAIAILGGSTLVRITAALYADVPLAAAIAGAAALLILAIETNQRGPAILAGFAAGCGAFTKNEGQLALLILAATAAAFGLRWLPWLAAGAAPLLATLAIFKGKVTAANGFVNAANAAHFTARLADLNRAWIAFWGFVSESLTFSNFLIPPIIVFGVWLALVKLQQPVQRHRFLPLIAAALQLTGYFFVFVMATPDLDWQISTSLGRLLLHVWPLALFGVFLVSSDN